MEELNLLIRGAGIALALLAGLAMLRDLGTHRIGRLGAAFAVGSAAYLVCSAPSLLAATGPIRYAVVLLCVANPALYWMFSRALFEERPQFGRAEWVPLAVLLLLWLPRLIVQPSPWLQPLEVLQQTLSFALVAHVIWVALYRRNNDLVDSRRAFRMPFAIATGILMAGIVVGEIALAGQEPPDALQVLAATLVTGIAGGALSLLVRTREERLFIQAPSMTPPASLAATKDDPDLQRLDAAMNTNAVWREEGLTIGRLAERLGLPEYKLRRLINRQLGFRNFSAFLNSYRIGEAKRRLGDPKEARIPILTIALEAGFGSIGPFNRAFRAETGMTPSAFRVHALTDS